MDQLLVLFEQRLTFLDRFLDALDCTCRGRTMLDGRQVAPGLGQGLVDIGVKVSLLFVATLPKCLGFVIVHPLKVS